MQQPRRRPATLMIAAGSTEILLNKANSCGDFLICYSTQFPYFVFFSLLYVVSIKLF
jgi:hypothetical protein